MAARRSSTSSSDSTSSGDEGTVKKNSFQAAEKEVYFLFINFKTFSSTDIMLIIIKGKKDSASKKFSSSESSSSDKEVTIQIKGSKLSKRVRAIIIFLFHQGILLKKIVTIECYLTGKNIERRK